MSKKTYGICDIFDSSNGPFTCRYCGETNGYHSGNCSTEDPSTEIGRKIKEAKAWSSPGSRHYRPSGKKD